MPAVGNLDFLLNDLERRLTDVRWALAVSPDGLQLARSSTLTAEQGDSFAAIASGLRGLARGVADRMDAGGLRLAIVEMERAYLFVSAGVDGSCVAVAASAVGDPGMIAFEMARLQARAGQVLTPPNRAGA